MTEQIYHPMAWLRHLPSGFHPEENEFPWELPEDTAWMIFDFIKNGRNIFHIETELSQLFEKTSIDELILEDIKLPYETIYIYFGDESGIYAPDYDEELTKIENSAISIEGAYVSRSTHNIRGFEEGSFWITLVPKYEEYEEEELFTYDINFELHTHKSGVIREGLKTKVVEQYESIFENPWERSGELEWKRMKNIGGKSSKSFEEVRDSWKPSMKDIAWKTAATKAMNIVLNTIVYLTTDESDVEEDYPNSYPKKLVEKSKGENSKQAERANSKLESMGYRKVKFIGRSIKKYFKSNVQNGDVSSHWRRGHWRKQPYGTKEEGLRKLIWIRPTIVNQSDEPNSNIPGHVYST